eukprot:SAG11_NODE_43170_length_169_cov_117.514286_1_plen_40_part_10
MSNACVGGVHLVPEDHGEQSVRNRAIKICTVEYNRWLRNP